MPPPDNTGPEAKTPSPSPGSGWPRDLILPSGAGHAVVEGNRPTRVRLPEPDGERQPVRVENRSPYPAFITDGVHLVTALDPGDAAIFEPKLPGRSRAVTARWMQALSTLAILLAASLCVYAARDGMWVATTFNVAVVAANVYMIVLQQKIRRNWLALDKLQGRWRVLK